MKVIEIKHGTIDTFGFDETIFIVMGGKIYSASPETGLIERTDLDELTLVAHLVDMNMDGFSVRTHYFKMERGSQNEL